MYDEFQDVWPGVVAGGVKFHVAQDDLVQVGVDDGFLVPDGFGNVMAARVDDAAAAAAGPLIQLRYGFAFNQVCRIHVLGKILVDVENVAAPFDGDMLDRILPFPAGLGGRRRPGHNSVSSLPVQHPTGCR